MKVKFFGIFAYIIAASGIILCFLVAPNQADSKNFVLSDFGANPQTSIIFASSLICASIFYYIFTYNFITRVNLKREGLITLTFLLSGAGLFILAVFPYTVSRAIHWAGAGTYFVLGALGVILLGSSILAEKRKLLGILLIILGVAKISLIIIGILFIKPFALVQTAYILLTGVWVILVTLYKSP